MLTGETHSTMRKVALEIHQLRWKIRGSNRSREEKLSRKSSKCLLRGCICVEYPLARAVVCVCVCVCVAKTRQRRNSAVAASRRRQRSSINRRRSTCCALRARPIFLVCRRRVNIARVVYCCSGGGSILPRLARETSLFKITILVLAQAGRPRNVVDWLTLPTSCTYTYTHVPVRTIRCTTWSVRYVYWGR